MRHNKVLEGFRSGEIWRQRQFTHAWLVRCFIVKLTTLISNNYYFEMVAPTRTFWNQNIKHFHGSLRKQILELLENWQLHCSLFVLIPFPRDRNIWKKTGWKKNYALLHDVTVTFSVFFLPKRSPKRQQNKESPKYGTSEKYRVGFWSYCFDSAAAKENTRNLWYNCPSSLYVFWRKLEFTRHMDCSKEDNPW